MNIDSILNVVFFAVGLGIGLLQLYIGQHQFEVQQREKMDELRRLLTDIQQRLAIMEEISSQRMFDVQDKLIRLAIGEEAVAEFTEDTVKQVQKLIVNELNMAGVQDSIERTKTIEAKLSKVLEKSASSLVGHAARFSVPELTARETDIIQLICEGRTNEQISEILRLSLNTVRQYIHNLMRKFGVNNRVKLSNAYLAMQNEISED